MLNKFAEFTNTILIDTKDFVFTIGDIILLLILFFVVRFLVFLFKHAIDKRIKDEKIEKGRAYAFYRVSSYFIYTISTVFALDMIGLNISVLLAGSTALLVGIGLGLQDTFKDFVSGIVLLLEGTITAGDIIEVDGVVSRVSEVKLRTTIMRSRDDIMFILPNNALTSNKVINWTQNSRQTRFSVEVGVAYGSDTRKVEQLLVEAALEIKDILNTPSPTVQFINFGDSSLDFKILFYSKQLFYIERVKSELRYLIDLKFREHKITIPFPQRDVWFKNENNNSPNSSSNPK